MTPALHRVPAAGLSLACEASAPRPPARRFSAGVYARGAHLKRRSIDNVCLVFYCFHARGKAKAGQRLAQIALRGRDVANQHSRGCAAKTIAEQTGEHRRSVGNVCAPSHESQNHVSQRRQRSKKIRYIRVRREGRIRLGSVSSIFLLPPMPVPRPTAPGGTRVPILLFGAGSPRRRRQLTPEPTPAAGGRPASPCRRLAAIAAIGDAAAAPGASQDAKVYRRRHPTVCARDRRASNCLPLRYFASRAPREAGARGAILVLHSQRSRPRAVQPVQAASD